MILTIDLNPTIDRKYNIDEISYDKEVRAKSSIHSPGGRGVTIATLLNIFNEKTLITGFLGGVNGAFYHRSLVEKGIIHKVITIKDEIKTNIEIINEENNKIFISENGPRITREDIVGFYELYDELIEKTNIVIGGSTLPQGVDTDIYFDLINLCNRKEKVFILDVVGEELSKSIDASPHIVIVSKKELEGFVNLNLNFELEIIKASKSILDKGVKILVVNLHENGILILEESKGYRLVLPNHNSISLRRDNTGILVGLALGISRSYDFEMTLKLSQAFNIAYTMEEDISTLDMSDIKRLMGEIDMSPINC